MDARVKPAHDTEFVAAHCLSTLTLTRYGLAIPLSESLPGLTRQSMMNRSSENQYCLRMWHLIMDARVKPAHDAEILQPTPKLTFVQLPRLGARPAAWHVGLVVLRCAVAVVAFRGTFIRRRGDRQSIASHRTGGGTIARNRRLAVISESRDRSLADRTVEGRLRQSENLNAAHDAFSTIFAVDMHLVFA
jgi:hypothetical protein